MLKILAEDEKNPSVKDQFLSLFNTPSVNIFEQLQREIVVGNVKTKIGMLRGMFHISGIEPSALCSLKQETISF